MIFSLVRGAMTIEAGKISDFDMKNFSQQSEKIMNQVTDAVEKTGKKVANQVSNITHSKAEEVTEEAIHKAVGQALDILRIAGESVRQEDMNAERVRLEVGVGIVNVAHLSITADVPSKENVDTVDVELS